MFYITFIRTQCLTYQNLEKATNSKEMGNKRYKQYFNILINIVLVIEI